MRYTIAAVLVIISTMPAVSDGYIPRGLGHPPDGPSHRYARECCSLRDCEPLEDGAVKVTDKGYEVRYLTSRGFIASGFIPFGDKRIKKPIETDYGHYHGCASPPYTGGEGNLLCLYERFDGS